MDIQVSSNFERQLFESVKRDSSIVNKIMKSFYDTGNQVLSQNIITVERKYFAEDKVKNSNFQETCQEIELKLNQITKKKCFMSRGKKLILKCLPRQIKCRKWTRPLFFAEYCEKGQEIHFVKKGKILDPLLKIQTCSSNENGPLKLRNFKLILEKTDLSSQKT